MPAQSRAFFYLAATFGEDIEWYKGGYSFVAYREKRRQTLRNCWLSKRAGREHKLVGQAPVANHVVTDLDPTPV